MVGSNFIWLLVLGDIFHIPIAFGLLFPDVCWCFPVTVGSEIVMLSCSLHVPDIGLFIGL